MTTNHDLDRLVDELGIKTVTAAELHAELDRLRARFRAERHLETDADIDAFLRAGKYSCSDELIEAWIETTALLGTAAP